MISDYLASVAVHVDYESMVHKDKAEVLVGARPITFQRGTPESPYEGGVGTAIAYELAQALKALGCANPDVRRSLSLSFSFSLALPLVDSPDDALFCSCSPTFTTTRRRRRTRSLCTCVLSLFARLALAHLAAADVAHFPTLRRRASTSSSTPTASCRE